MKIWVDADAAPKEVKEIVLRGARRLQVEAVLVANQRLSIPPGFSHASTVTVPGGPDAADQYIVEHARAGDVAVTADIPLAALLVEVGVAVIDPRGEEYNAANIGERLAVRDWMDGLRGAGVEMRGARPYGPGDKQKFANALDRLLTTATRKGRLGHAR